MFTQSPLYLACDQDWRYTAWVGWNGTALQPVWGDVRGRELYAHQGDMGDSFDKYENENLAGEAQYAGLVAQLHQTLQAAFSSD